VVFEKAELKIGESSEPYNRQARRWQNACLTDNLNPDGKFSTDKADFQAQNPLTVTNIGG
jgi:hypothetical protein